MRQRGQTEHEGYNNGEYCYGDQNMSSFPCTKHPYSASSSSTTGGICAYCLTDRLYQLVCPQCGEQRLPSCSCSDVLFSSNPNSSSNDNSASAGRVSFQWENDQNNVAEISCPRPSRTDNISILGSNDHQQYQQRYLQEEDFGVAPPLRRSNSTCVDMNRTRDQGRSGGAFSKLGKLFRKKKDKKSYNNFGSNNLDEINGDTNKTEIGMPEPVGLTRSRSMCNFRGLYDAEESGGIPMTSFAARASNVSVNNCKLDSAKMSCFSESEARMSNFDYDPSFVGPNRNVCSFKESDFSRCGDDPAFIDLKLNDMSSDSRSDLPFPGLRRGGFGMSSTREFGYNRGGEFMSNNYGGRYSNVSQQELRKNKKNNKGWKWFFRHQTSSSSRRKDEDYHHGFN